MQYMNKQTTCTVGIHVLQVLLAMIQISMQAELHSFSDQMQYYLGCWLPRIVTQSFIQS